MSSLQSNDLGGKVGRPGRILAALIILAACPVGGRGRPSGDQEPALPSAESILDRYVEVTGGKAAYTQLHNILSIGTFYVAGTSMRGTFKAYEAEPNRSLSIIEIEGGEKIEEGTLGDVAWDRSSKEGPRLKEGEEKAISLREATFNSRLKWRLLYKNAACVGAETVGERKCYKVVLTPSAGGPLTQYYDAESGLLVRSVITVNSPAGPVPSENNYSDYQESNGVLFPRKLAHRVGSEETVVVLDSVRCNADIAWYRFDLPSEVKALLAKSRR
jgi:hypothetical protein